MDTSIKVTNYRKCAYRDRAILEFLQEQKVLSSSQIYSLLFNSVSIQMCYRRLRVLLKKKAIRKIRLSMDESNLFYIGKRPDQVDHKVGVNWIWILFEKHLKYQRGDKLANFEKEVTEFLPFARPDGYIWVDNTATKARIPYFAEFHRWESGNKFDKVQKYTKLFESWKGGKDYSWQQYSNGFPAIIIVTTGPKSQVKTEIQNHNRHGLDFQVYTLEEVIEQCMKRI